MSTGTVKFYNEERGYGFIKETEGTDVFFHVSNCRDSNDQGVDLVRIGDRVTFSIEPSKKKPGTMQAYNVKLIEGDDDGA